MFLTATEILARCLAHAATRAGGGEVGGAPGEGLRASSRFFGDFAGIQPACAVPAYRVRLYVL